MRELIIQVVRKYLRLMQPMGWFNGAMKRTWLFAFPLMLVSLEGSGLAQGSLFHGDSILDSLQSFTASTIPSNGDLNPYGVAFVPPGFPSGGAIAAGDVLVANFNNSGNKQGTGTTIISVSPTGQQSLFVTSSATSGLIGLDTALGVLTRGFVVVGNLPVSYPQGGSPTPGQGTLQFFDRSGNQVLALNDATLLDSPWDLVINDQGSQAQIFVSNVLSGTVTRVNVSISNNSVMVVSKTRIGSGYAHQPNAGAVVVGPTGLAYDRGHDTLYVASTGDNKIFAISDAGDATSDAAGMGAVVFADQQHLHGPLGLVLTPQGNLITANGDAAFAGGTQNDLVEFTPHGNLVATYQLDAGPPGGAFGIAVTARPGPVRFAAVDDNLNTVTVWTLHSDN
jgi:hypothetical protein